MRFLPGFSSLSTVSTAFRPVSGIEKSLPETAENLVFRKGSGKYKHFPHFPQKFFTGRAIFMLFSFRIFMIYFTPQADTETGKNRIGFCAERKGRHEESEVVF